jgi:hypothetical protein
LKISLPAVLSLNGQQNSISWTIASSMQHANTNKTDRLETWVDFTNREAQYGLSLTLCTIVDFTLFDMSLILWDNLSLDIGTI